ncbi:MAG: glycosyltransferase, partial [Candidatus Omnitrophica bacterium]|nr:glycosyltransferase [Candidatus Omnitrophota bacterium]
TLFLMSAMVYVIAKAATFFFVSYRPLDRFFAVSLILSELFLFFHSLGYVLNVFRALGAGARLPVRSGERSGGRPAPSAALLVAARHEPAQVLRETFRALKNIDYPNKTVYFLDDSSDEKYREEAQALARELDLTLVRRTKPRHGAKAGIINDCLETLQHDFVAIFDADQRPITGFLKTLIPLFESDEKLGFVQTPQFYSNIHESRVARASAFQQAVFYEYICEGKNTTGTVFSCGTNIIFSRKALMEVGGLDESTITEDFATSMLLHERGWKSLYYPHVSTFGLGPEALGSYFKQQFRWAMGTLTVFRRMLLRIFSGSRRLKPIQVWEYFLSGSYYLVGMAYLILMLCPLAYLFFRIPTAPLSTEVYLFAFLPYAAFPMFVFYVALGRRNYRISDLARGQLLAIATFPVYIRAAVAAIFGFKAEFAVTEKSRMAALPLSKLWPQIGMLLANFAGVVWAINRFITEKEAAIAINGFWALYHFVLLSGIFYFNADVSGEEAPRLSSGAVFDCKVVSPTASYQELGRVAWTTRFSVPASDSFQEGSLLMCKVRKKDEVLIFDGLVLSLGRRKAEIGVVTIPDDARKKLEGWMVR